MFRRSPHDVPLATDSSMRYVAWIIGTMVFLSVLVLAAALVLESGIERWQMSNSVQLTVEVPPSAAAGGGLDRVLTKLRDLPGVVAAAPLSDEKVGQLLAPWIGKGLDISQLPLPTLIDVTTAAPGAVDVDAAQGLLDKVEPGVRVDDGRRWLEPVRATAASLQAISGLVLVLIGAASIVTIVFMTRTGLAVHRDTIAVLHQVGARDSYVARQFQRHALRLALWGGLPGLGLAALCLVVIGRVASRLNAPLLPDLSLGAGAWLAVAAVPFVAALIAVLTARVTVLATLGRMP